MKTLLILLSLLATASLLGSTAYRGLNYTEESCQSIADHLGTVTAQEVKMVQNPEHHEVVVTVEGITAQEQTDLDALMVTTNGLTKQ